MVPLERFFEFPFTPWSRQTRAPTYNWKQHDISNILAHVFSSFLWKIDHRWPPALLVEFSSISYFNLSLSITCNSILSNVCLSGYLLRAECTVDSGYITGWCTSGLPASLILKFETNMWIHFLLLMRKSFFWATDLVNLKLFGVLKIFSVSKVCYCGSSIYIKQCLCLSVCV